MFDIKFSDEIAKAVPHLRVIAVEADIDNGPTSDGLWSDIDEAGRKLKDAVPLDQVNKLRGIAATRQAYKACGKEPNRYRPSAEALTRRMVKGVDLYRTLTAIDLINLISLETGHSIGGFDADKIEGASLVLGIGREGESFEAIGRGALNIANLPIYRDAVGGIGTPTSDCERTKLTPDSKHLLMLVNIYDKDSDIMQFQQYIEHLLPVHGCMIKNINIISSLNPTS